VIRKTGQKRRGYSAKLTGCHELFKRYKRKNFDHALAAVMVFISICIIGSASLLQLSASGAQPYTGNQILSQSLYLKPLSDGSLNVAEVIDLQYITPNTFRGILREIPAKPRNLQVDYQRRGNDDFLVPQYEFAGNTLSIISSSNSFLEPGIHRYQVQYSLAGQARGSNNGEIALDWNITGNQRWLPIGTAFVIVHPPADVKHSDLKASFFVRAKSASRVEPFLAYTRTDRDNGSIQFKTERLLKKDGEALIGYAVIVALIAIITLTAMPGLGHWAAKTLCEVPIISGPDREYNKETNKCCRPDDSECHGQAEPCPGGLCM